MADTYKTPGVYIKEIPLFPPSVAPVETAIPAFIGYTQKASRKSKGDLYRVPTRISSLLEFTNYFGGAKAETTLQINLRETKATVPTGLPAPDDTEQVRTGIAATAQVADNATTSPFILYYAMQMYFANGGGPCYIISVGIFDSEELGSSGATVATAISSADLVAGLAPLKKEDEPTLIVFPDAINLVNSDGDPEVSQYGFVQQQSLLQCAELKDRFAVMDVLPDTNDRNTIITFRGAIGNDNLKYGAAYWPFLNTTLDYAFDEAQVNFQHFVSVDGGAFTLQAAGADSFTDVKLNAIVDPTTNANNDIYNLARQAIGELPVVLGPSSTMVGIYAAVDRTRGVWKAPANVSVSNIFGPSIKATNDLQDFLNVDGTGKSINAIRTFKGKGHLVWGSRTLDGNDNEWRYVPVRRFFNFAEESIKKATERFVFEPNDANTWTKVRAMIENFLLLQWRAGALAGAVPEDAFFVNVGLGETMTALDILEGRMNVEIGMAVVRPAEFIILKFSHKLPEA